MAEVFGADIQNKCAYNRSCVGAFSAKIKLRYWLFRGSDDGTTKRLVCWFVHPSTEQLLCFVRLLAMAWCLCRKTRYCTRPCTIVAQFLIGGPDYLGGHSREKGGSLAPCYVNKRRFSNRAFEPSFSQRRRRTPRAWFTPIENSSHWGTKGRLGELILMLNNLLKWSFHVMWPLIKYPLWRLFYDVTGSRIWNRDSNSTIC